jgi:RIO kinase 1
MSLEQLLEDGVVDELLGRLKSGKEADVWLVRHRDEVLCAKVYKDRSTRSFKNNSGYKEGRAVRNSRTQRAMDRGSRFGQAAAEEAWKSAESDALHKLHAQGVRVPAPVIFYEGILLMKLVLDAEGHPAPRLIETHPTPERAGALYADLRAQAVRMLCADLIHGDLSPYNVLLGAEGPTLIDFPQVVAAAHNSTAEMFFKRDLDNLRKFFAGFDPSLHQRTGDAEEIWRAYVRRDLSPDFVPSGKVQQREAKRHGHPQRQQQGARPQHGAGQRPPPRPHGQQHGPRPHGQQQHAPRPHGQQQQHAPRPHGQQQHAPRPHGQPAPRQGPNPRQESRPGPVVERVHHHVRHPRPPNK